MLRKVVKEPPLLAQQIGSNEKMLLILTLFTMSFFIPD